MKIKLKNIGIIKDSSILLDGLTVITGKNNSGKTTIGKALYSVINAVANIPNKAQSDKYTYIMKQLDNIAYELEYFKYLLMYTSDHSNIYINKESSLFTLLRRNYRNELRPNEYEEFANKLHAELINIKCSVWRNAPELSLLATISPRINIKTKRLYTEKDLDKIIEKLDAQREKAIQMLDNLFISISNDPEFIDYIRESINQTLNIEFSRKIQSFHSNNNTATIEITNNDSLCFLIKIKNDQVINESIPVFIHSPYKKTFFIDDPFVLNISPSSTSFRMYDIATYYSLLDVNQIHTHDYNLKLSLKQDTRQSILEKTIQNKSLIKVNKHIDKILPGNFNFTSEGDFYIEKGEKLPVANLATGSKMFSIIKLLLENGEIDDTTMLILDEPEAHLHPEWQNIFAEVIVMLVKEVGVNILLTTHSPNFMLAIDAYMRKYEINDKTNFYQTQQTDDGFVEYSLVNDDLGLIYSDFLTYLSEVKLLRDNYLEGAKG